MKLYEKERKGNARIIKILGHKVLSYRKNIVDNQAVLDGIDDLKAMFGCQVLETRKIRPPENIQDAELKVYSQWGEDGIIQWIINRIPNPVPIFIEFGVENYMESNTRFLLVNNNWSGLVIDGSEDHIESVRGRDFFWRHDLKAVCSFVDKDNINSLFADNGFQGEIGILSVDLDGVDYWVLHEINTVNPQIIICEFNGVFGVDHAVTVPYDAEFQRQQSHFSGQYFGASLKALESLLKHKGYSLIGINSTSVNAFFIRNDLADRFTVTNAETCFLPLKRSDVRDISGRLTFIRDNTEKLRLMREKLLVDVLAGKTSTIAELYGV